MTDSVEGDKAKALGKGIRRLREARQWSRAELLDRFYRELAKAGVDYKIRGDWWLDDVENGEKAKQLPRAYIMAFIQALNCTKLEAIQLLGLADLNTLISSSSASYTAGITFVLTEIFTNALEVAETQIDETTAARLSEREWLVIGKTVLELVIADLEQQLQTQT